MHLLEPSLVLLLAALAAPGAQAARLTLLSGSVAGGIGAQASAGSGSLAFAGAIVDQSSANAIGGSGAGDGQATWPTGGVASLRHQWTRQAVLVPAVPTQGLTFQTGSTTVFTLVDTGPLDGAYESSQLLLQAELRIVGDGAGEVDGTPVQLRLTGLASSLLHSPGLSDTTDLPSFDLVLRDEDSAVLASWQGLALNSSETFDIGLPSQVGRQLSLSIGYANTLEIGAQTLGGTAAATSVAMLAGQLRVSAVPEPQTWALWLAGLLATGGLARRRA